MRLRRQMIHSQWTDAVNDLSKAKFVLRSYSSTPSFKTIRDDCSQLVCDIQQKIWDQFGRAVGWVFVSLCEPQIGKTK